MQCINKLYLSDCDTSIKCHVVFGNQVCCPNVINIYGKLLTLHENPIDKTSCKILLFSFSPRFVNSLWPSDVIWRLRSGSILAQVMACCLTPPSHYLNQCWRTINMVHWHLYRAVSQEIPQPLTTKISLKITHLKFTLNLPGANELNWLLAISGPDRPAVCTRGSHHNPAGSQASSLWQHFCDSLQCRCMNIVLPQIAG